MDCESVRRGVHVGSGESGAILIVVVLITMTLFVLGHGLLLSSRSALLAASAGARLVETRAAADGVVADLLENVGGRWMDSVDVWARGGELSLASGAMTLTGAWRRVGPEAWLVEASARASDGYPVTSTRLVWVYDAVERVGALPAVVSVGAGAIVSVAGEITGDSALSVGPPGDPDMCTPWLSRLEDVLPTGTMPPIGSIDGPTLGYHGFDQLVAAAPIEVAGIGTPGPRRSLGVCATDEAWNWGDPDRPTLPCGAHFALRIAPGGLDVLGGVGQGILIVDGDLVFRADSRFYGLVIITGVLSVLDDATLEGMAVAYGGVDIGPNATVRGSACWTVRSLAALRPTLGPPVSLHSAKRLGPF